MTSAPAIGFEYRPSRWLSRVLLPVSTLAVLAGWLSAIPFVLKMLLTVAVVMVTWRVLARFAHPRVAAAGWSRDGGWSLRMIDGEDVPATLSASRVVSGRMVWLYLRAPGAGHIPLLLAPDNSDTDIRRRLCMRLALVASKASLASGTLADERGPTV